MKWEEENKRRRREHTLPPPNQYVAWTLNWLNDYIQTNKCSTIKMELDDSENPDKANKTKTNSSTSNDTKKPHNNNNKNGKSNGNRRTLNNFYMMADQKNQQTKDKEVSCLICEGKHHVYKCKMEVLTPKVARGRVMKAGACINCLSTDHYIAKCKAGGCRVKGCGRKHNTRLHDPDLNNSDKKTKIAQCHSNLGEEEECSSEKEKDTEVICFNQVSSYQTVHLPIVKGYLCGSPPIPINIILGTGSSVNFVSTRQVGIRLLNFHIKLSAVFHEVQKDVTIAICNLEGKKNCKTKVVNFGLSQPDGLKVEAYVVDRIH